LRNHDKQHNTHNELWPFYRIWISYPVKLCAIDHLFEWFFDNLQQHLNRTDWSDFLNLISTDDKLISCKKKNTEFKYFFKTLDSSNEGKGRNIENFSKKSMFSTSKVKRSKKFWWEPLDRTCKLIIIKIIIKIIKKMIINHNKINGTPKKYV
jgi:hypothetical protein